MEISRVLLPLVIFEYKKAKSLIGDEFYQKKKAVASCKVELH